MGKLVLLLCLLPAAALAQTSTPAAKKPAADLRPLFLPTVHYGAPLKLAAGLAVFFPTAVEGGPRSRGWIAEAGAGQGGFRASFGRASFLEYFGLDARAVVTRTFASPRGAAAESTYAGAEVGMHIAYVHASIGVLGRVSGPDGAHGTIRSWTLGAQWPLKK